MIIIEQHDSFESFENNNTLICWDWLGTLEVNDMINPLAVKLLQTLHADKIKQCIVSNGSIEEIKKQLIKYKLEEYFETIAGIELNLPLKPNVDMLYHCAKIHSQKYHVELQTLKLIFIGDSSSDRMLVQNAIHHGLQCEYVDIQQIHTWMK